MKKISLFLMMFGLVVTSCTTDDIDRSFMEKVKADYNDLFTQTYGEIAPNHDWGFSASSGMRGLMRGIAYPEVADIPQPYDEAWVAEYLATAKEPNSTNVYDNYDNSYWEGPDSTWVVDVPGHNETVVVGQEYVEGQAWGWGWQGTANSLLYGYGNDWFDYKSQGISDEDYAFWEQYCIPFNNENWALFGADNKEDATFALMEILESTGRKDSWCNIWTPGTKGGYQDKTETVWVPEQGHWEYPDKVWVPDEDYVRNFKITGTWDGGISVASSEGEEYARTIVVTGTWNLTEDQRIGGSGKIIVANGGTINVSEGKSLQFVNEGRFVVLPGGSVKGAGTVEVTNGNDEGLEGYNGGTIEVGKFNNNFGKFYNYGTFKADILAGGAGGSNFYNHSLAVIGGSENLDSSTANTRVFNACQFYCTGDVRMRNYEGIMGSSLIVDGTLMLSGGTDGSSDPSYVALAAGALVKCGELYNNGTSWNGPTENGYAVLSMGKITYLNWEQDHPENGGYFANNIYVQADDWTNAPDGNGMGGEDAAAKFENVRNAAGNGNVTVVKTGDYEVIPADGDYKKGESGCTPGFKITEPDDDNDPDPTPEPDPDPTPEEPEDNTIYGLKKRIIAEDLAAGQFNADFDFNDVVFDAQVNVEEVNGVQHYVAHVEVLAAGGTLPLYIGDTNYTHEVHYMFGEDTGTMINTGLEYGVEKNITPQLTIDLGAVNGGATDEDALVRKINDIPVYVVSSVRGQYELTTELTNIEIDGTVKVRNAPMKIAVPTDYRWTLERKEVSTAYPKFKDYVGNPNIDWTHEGNINTNLLY